jgi:hypothetical protein
MISGDRTVAFPIKKPGPVVLPKGSTSFRAEFDLTGQHRNFYPAISDLSHISRGLRRLLPKVLLPDQVLREASKRRDADDVVLPVYREVEIQAHLSEQGNPVSFTSTNMGAEWWEPEPIEVAEEGNETYDFLPGEEKLLDACIVYEKGMVEALEQLPGCRFLSVGCRATVNADSVEES